MGQHLLNVAFRLVVAGIVALALVACTDRSRPHATLLVVSPEFESKIAEPGQLRGELGVSREGCVTLKTSGDEYVVWASYGSSLKDKGTAFKLADVGVFKLGEEVDLPGVVSTAYRPARELVPTAYTDCLSEDESGQITAAFLRARPEDLQ